MGQLGRVDIYGESMHNLLPRSIADKLSLHLHFSVVIRIIVCNHSIPIIQYCPLSVQVAGVETAINFPSTRQDMDLRGQVAGRL